jgi:hypothetical protein
MKKFLFDIWASGDPIAYTYIVSWVAGLVTNLTGINQVALVMVSRQGAGKGTFLEFLEYILRKTNILSVNGVDAVVGKFNRLLQGKRLINMNEMSSTAETFRSNFDKLKMNITDPTILIQPKGVDHYSVKNISNYLVFTNHRDAVIVEVDDRRYPIFEMATTKLNDEEFFNTIREKCFNQDVADEFYTYLLDFPAVSLRKIPMTPLRMELMELSKPSASKFLDFYLNPARTGPGWDGEQTVQANTLYNMYKN